MNRELRLDYFAKILIIIAVAGAIVLLAPYFGLTFTDNRPLDYEKWPARVEPNRPADWQRLPAHHQKTIPARNGSQLEEIEKLLR